MMNSKHTVFFATCCFFVATLAACSLEDENAAEVRLKAFAQNYFNLRFKQAAKFCTPESEKFIRCHASNIRQSDLDVLDAQSDTAVCEIIDIDMNDDTANAIINVENFLCCDSVMQSGFICKKAKFGLSMQKVEDKWLVVMTRPI